MNPTHAFLRLVWPVAGKKTIVSITDGITKHFWFDQGQEKEAAFKALALAESGQDVYYGLAGFLVEERKQQQVSALKALWLDIDVGEGKSYPTRNEAIVALQQFLEVTTLPVPMIVSSGYGLHVYFLLNKELTLEEWRPRAERLKILCKTHGLLADLKCTADSARILRPVGTSNFKNGEPRPVKIANTGSITISDNTLFNLIDAVPYDVFTSLAKELPDGGHEAKPIFESVPSSDFEQILGQCATIRWAYENQNDVAEPLWYDCLGVAGFCTDATSWGHRLSSGYAGYNAVHTERKISQRVGAAGPTTCNQFRMADNSQCDTCPHKITSPIQLGYTKNIGVQYAPTKPSISSTITRYVNPLIRVTTHGLEVRVPDSNKHQQSVLSTGPQQPTYSWVYIAPHGISPLLELRLPDGSAAATNHVWFDVYNDSGRSIDNFVVPSQAISNSQLFSAECAKRGMYFESETAILAYRTFHKIMRTWVAQMKAKQGPIITFRSFGWSGPDDKDVDKDAFLLGNTLYTKTGEYITPLVPELAAVQSDIRGRGDLGKWTQAINNYNLPGMESYMFASWCGWGAPLMHFTTSGSVIFHVLGETGVGKTSLQRAIISIYGDYHSKMLLDVSDSTNNSVGGMMGILKNLPYLREEATERDAEDLATWSLSVTHGRERGRLSSSLANAQVRTWSTIAITSANASLREAIITQRMDSPARLARVWEQEMELPFTQAEAAKLFEPMATNYGLAGPIYIRHCVEHFDSVKQRIHETERYFSEKLHARGPDRFFICLLAVNYVGACIAKELGLIAHDIDRGLQWAIRHFKKLRNLAQSEKQTPEQSLSRFIQETQPQTLSVEIDQPSAAKGIIFNSENNILRNVAQSNSITMRFAKDTSTFYATSTIIRKWYADNHLNFESEMRQLETLGILVDRHKRMVLTRGTKHSDSKQTWCMWFDLSKSKELVSAVEDTDEL